MIRTGYLRWEIEVADVRSRDDRLAREVIFLARPTYRIVRVKSTGHIDAADRFVRGEATYDSVLRTLRRQGGETEVRVPDVGPRPFRYSESDRSRMPRYWMEKLQREAGAFAHEAECDLAQTADFANHRGKLALRGDENGKFAGFGKQPVGR